jgi:hypothetical protein
VVLILPFTSKGTKISGYWRHPKKCDDSTESCSTTGIPKMLLKVASTAAEREFFEVTPLSKL